MAAALLLSFGAVPALAASILFIGNSFTYAYGSPVRYYRVDTVTDLNSDGQGGVPALFKSFADQAGLSYEVFLETEPGVGIDWHLSHKLPVIGRHAWDAVVMHGYSTLDPAKPGDPGLLVSSVRQMAGFLRTTNGKVDIFLTATWPRADQVYLDQGAWYGKSIEVMAKDIRNAYNQAAAGAGSLKVVPVGDSWVRAMRTGVADPNPYDGIDADKMNLWTYDGYHASVYGYYLEAMMLFGLITGHDPRGLGQHECSGFELGLSSTQVAALEQVAFDQLAAESTISAPAARTAPMPSPPTRCAATDSRRPKRRASEN